MLHPAQALHAQWRMEKQTLLCASSRTFVPAVFPMCKSWVTAPIQPLPPALQSPRCLTELEPSAQVPDTVRLPRSPSARHMGMFAPGLLTRQRASGSRQVARAGKCRSWDPQGLLSLPQAKTLPFPRLKQAQLVAPHGSAPETPAGGKKQIRTRRLSFTASFFLPFLY